MNTVIKFLISFFVCSALAMPTLAKGLGFLWASNPSSTGAYSPAAVYSFNGLNRPMSVERVALGQYRATFSGLGAVGQWAGNVLVNAYGSQPSHCQPSSWDTSSGDFKVYVSCFTLGGIAADSPFTISVRYPERSGLGFAYAWAGQPEATSYTPANSFFYNPTGGTVLVNKNTTGIYYVTFTNVAVSMRNAGGNVQVNGYGSRFANCSLGSWRKNLNNLVVEVHCFNEQGLPQNAPFTVFATWPGELYPLTQGYVFSETPTPPANHAPAPNYSVGRGNTVSRTSTGSYVVSFGPYEAYQMPPLASTVHVSAYDSSALCKVSSWNDHGRDRLQKIDAYIDCYSNSGEKMDTQFSALTLYPYVVP